MEEAQFVFIALAWQACAPLLKSNSYDYVRGVNAPAKISGIVMKGQSFCKDCHGHFPSRASQSP